MAVFARMQKHDFEQIIAVNNNASRCRALVVIHDTTLGPAFGGLRFWKYATEEHGLEDVCRLARAMTYKCALAGIRGGGGKTVIFLDDRMDRAAAVRHVGRVIENLGGRYFAGRDVGCTDADMKALQQETKYVASEELSDATATGVLQGIRACLAVTRGADALDGVRIAIQGLGRVGYLLAKKSTAAGARVTASDIDEQHAHAAEHELGVSLVAPERILDEECEVFAPCALGGVVNDATAKRLKCGIVAGAANNVLEEESDGLALHERGILYAPDYVINAGALISGATRLLTGTSDSGAQIQRLFDVIREIGERSRREGMPTNYIANMMAEAKLKKSKAFSDSYWPEA
ncbi:MAG: amino acid dehydrogenase [Planctomycetes bacterium]|nr:amino acid dehydrogenase [Planctomycetota bacterium]